MTGDEIVNKVKREKPKIRETSMVYSEEMVKREGSIIAEAPAHQGMVPWLKERIWGSPPVYIQREPRIEAGQLQGEDSETTMPENPSQTLSKNYSSMNPYYAWFRRDRLVKRCTTVNAYFAVLAAGFETVLEATDKDLSEADQKALLEKHADVKTFIDDMNQKLKWENVLFVTQIKRSIWGKSVWEIVKDTWKESDQEYPDWLLSLNSDKAKAKQDKKTWELQGWTYGNVRQNPPKYTPEEIFWMTNLQLENDYEGISDVEAVTWACDARIEIFTENYPEIVRTLWAPAYVASVDTSMMSQDKETSFLRTLANRLRSGKAIAVNKSIEVKAISLSADIAGLRNMQQDLQEEIIGNYGTPRFLLGKPIENRATAYAEFEAYVDGPIAGIQKELKRKSEEWWDYWTRIYLMKDASSKINLEEGEKAPVEVKMVPKIIRTSDVYQAAQAAAQLWGPSGLGPLGLRNDYKKIWEMMGWPVDELEPVASSEDPEE